VNTLDDYLASLPQDDAEPVAALDFANELVVDKKTGAVRQAGADATGAAVVAFKQQAERSLFVFAYGVMGRTYLTPALHRGWCDSIQRVPPRRKLRLYPRHHCKTTIVSHALPIHILIQPAEHNIYFEGQPGNERRILLSGETEKLAAGNLRVVQSAFESNKILRGLWPHLCWDKARVESKKWNDLELIVPRETEFPEASITARGVGGAITGLHPDVLIKDDLISFEAANSEAVMQTAISWHIASRGLIEGNPDALEFIVGTRWAAFDLYRYIIENDTLVDVDTRSAIENGQVIYPEKFDLDTLDRLRKEFRNLYPLLYLNTAIGAGLTDFDMALVRAYRIVGDAIEFDADERDVALGARGDAATTSSSLVGSGDESHAGRDEFLRHRYPSRLVS
jgi:hypothetical protein